MSAERQQPEVIYVAGLAGMLGKTEASIRDGIRRGVSWLPKGFKMGQEWAWLREDVYVFLRERRDGKPVNPKLGRQRKTPPTLASIQR